MKIFRTILFVALWSPVIVLQAQPIERYNSFSYSVNEGLLQTTIADLAFDKNNFCWLSFPNGIQKFDGENFTSVEIQTGLPDDKFVYFFRGSNGDLFLAHSYGISKYEIVDNRFIQVYSVAADERNPPQFIGEDEGIIYFYTRSGYITGMDRRSCKIISQTKAHLSQKSDDRIKASDNIINHKAALLVNSKIYLWDLQERKLLNQSAVIPQVSVFMLRLKTENEVIYIDNNVSECLQIYNFTTNKTRTHKIKGNVEKSLSRCIILPWQNKTLVSFSTKIYETDENLENLKSQIVNFQNNPMSGLSGVARIIVDNFGNLMIATVSRGIKKIIRNNYPIKYYGTEKIEDNFTISILPDKKNNRVLVGTAGNGLLIFDTTQRLIKHIRTLPGDSLPFSPNIILKTKTGDYLVFNAGEKKVWLLNKNLSKLSTIPIHSSLPESKRGINYFGNTLSQNEQEAILQSQDMFYRTNFVTNTIEEHQFTNFYTLSGLMRKDVIMTHTNDELIFINPSDFKELNKIKFKNTGGVRCFAKDDTDNIYMGSNKGVFKIDSSGKILSHLSKKNGLSDECIYAMVVDDEGYLWGTTNKGIFRLNKDKSILQLTKNDGLQENEFNTNVAAKADDGEIFFGGVNGVSSFYPASIVSHDEKINLLFTDIKINNKQAFKDSASWTIDNMDLRHDQNSLSFDFIAMANANPGQYIYQYRMKGIDEQWLQNDGLQTVRYFLPPGKYIFQVAASRYFNSNAAPMKEIVITIHPPFWRTWWFVSTLVLVSLSIMTLAINQYNRDKYQKKLALLEAESRIRVERERISRDLHDSIGAYANTVLYKSELLQEEKNITERRELIKDLQFNSKDIITSLRETIWALKKPNFTAEDCFLRITNFVMPFNRYYPHCKFKIEGKVPAEKSFDYSKALHLVRIVQEAISNAIKHADAKNINIQSSVENGSWKLVISDDGKGFDYTTTKDLQLGNGLNNIEQRAKDAGIIFSINSAKNSGTSITILC